MLTIIEYPTNRYNIHNNDTGESIAGLHLHELDNLKRMITGINVAKMPDLSLGNDHVKEPFKSILEQIKGGSIGR